MLVGGTCTLSFNDNSVVHIDVFWASGLAASWKNRTVASDEGDWRIR